MYLQLGALGPRKDRCGLSPQPVFHTRCPIRLAEARFRENLPQTYLRILTWAGCSRYRCVKSFMWERGLCRYKISHTLGISFPWACVESSQQRHASVHKRRRILDALGATTRRILDALGTAARPLLALLAGGFGLHGRRCTWLMVAIITRAASS